MHWRHKLYVALVQSQKNVTHCFMCACCMYKHSNARRHMWVQCAFMCVCCMYKHSNARHVCSVRSCVCVLHVHVWVQCAFVCVLHVQALQCATHVGAVCVHVCVCCMYKHSNARHMWVQCACVRSCVGAVLHVQALQCATHVGVQCAAYKHSMNQWVTAFCRWTEGRPSLCDIICTRFLLATNSWSTTSWTRIHHFSFINLKSNK